MMRLDLAEVSAKVRTGGPERRAGGPRDCPTGPACVPVRPTYGDPEPAPDLDPSVPLPDYLRTTGA